MKSIGHFRELAGGVVILLALSLTSRYNYLLFHTLAELFSIMVSTGIFMITWNARHKMKNNYLLFLGIASLFIGGVDLLHTLAYKGMMIFAVNDANLATQLWIAARYLQSLSFLIAPLWFIRPLKTRLAIGGYTVVSAMLTISVFGGVFPTCYVEGMGLTLFKKLSEYLICLILAVSILLLYRVRERLDREIWHWLSWSIGCMIVAELSFTLYVSVYGFSNLVGHLSKIAAFYFLYKAIITASIAHLSEDVTKLKQTEIALYQALGKAQQHAKEIAALLNGSKAVLEYDHFEEVARKIFYTCARITGATAGYVALLSEDGAENEVLFLEAGGRPCDVDPELPMPIRGLREQSYRTNSTVYDNDFMHSPWVQYMPEGHVKMDNVLFAPLVIENKTVGVIGLANKSGDFTENDARLASAFGEYAAIALRNARNLEALQASEHKYKLAKEAAESANRAKSSFLAHMSHELRTPLNGILGYTQILKRKADLKPQQQHGLEVIERSGNHLLLLLNDILDLAKIEAGKVELHPDRIHLPGLLQEVSELIRIRAEKKRISFALEPSAELPTWIWADQQRLRQILLNLLGNAVKFTETGGVTLRVTTKDKRQEAKGQEQADNFLCLCFEVEDTGTGIPAEDLQNIFEPFQQAGNLDNRAQGTGLGLSITRNLLALMGTTLQVKSEEGAGSAFCFELAFPPVSSDEKEYRIIRRTIRGVKTMRSQPDRTPKILIVDDEEDNRHVFRDLLIPLGFELQEADGGEQGLAAAKVWRPDLMVIDLRMPDMNGFELIRYVRQDPLLRQSAIIASSASVFSKDRQKSVEAGSQAFLPKPIDPELLFTQLQDLLTLEWTYDEASDENEADEDRFTELVLPSIDMMVRLHDLAQMGDILELRRQVTNLVQAEQAFTPFAAQLQPLMKQFKLRQVAQILDDYLNRKIVYSEDEANGDTTVEGLSVKKH